MRYAQTIFIAYDAAANCNERAARHAANASYCALFNALAARPQAACSP